MGEIHILHAADSRGFSCRLAAQLAAEGHSVIRRDASDLNANASNSVDAAHAVIAVWSGDMLAAGAMMDTARQALARRILVPVSIGAVEPPGSFAHLWPIDLDGWNGEESDPRWQFVRDEIELARRRVEAAATIKEPPRPRPRRRTSSTASKFVVSLPRIAMPAKVSPPLIAASLVGVGAIAGVVLLMTNLRGDPVVEAQTAPPFIGFIEPAKAAESDGAGPASSTTTPAVEIPAPPEIAVETVLEPAPTQLAAADVAGSQADQFIEDVVAATASPASEMAPTGAVEEAPFQTAVVITKQSTDEAVPLTGGSSEPGLADEQVAGVDAEELAAAPLPPPSPDTFTGFVFRDCLDCPDMAEIPAGQFSMGAAAGEAGASATEQPVRTVSIAKPFALSRREVTFADWDKCVAGGGCRAFRPADGGWGRGDRPVINVSFDDAAAYIAWLSKKTGRQYRLPSEAEWEYAARAGSTTPFSFGAGVSVRHANYEDARRARTVPAGSFAPSAFGLYDMHGNVWEWVADCWRGGHADLPIDGSPVVGECDERVLKGGAYNTSGWRLRAAHRIAKGSSAREPDNGFRIARDLP